MLEFDRFHDSPEGAGGMPLALVAELRVQERAAYEELARALADHDDFLADTLISRIAELHEISVRHQPEMAS